MHLVGLESADDSCEKVIRQAKEYLKTTHKHHPHLIERISLSLSSLSMKQPLNPHHSFLIASNYHCQGSVERKCLLKNYKKPNITKWKKYWLAVCENFLFFHKQRSLVFTFPMRLNRPKTAIDVPLTENERFCYRQNPSKCQSVSDCLIVLSQAKDRNEIQLSDLNRGEELHLFSKEKAYFLRFIYRIDVQV